MAMRRAAGEEGVLTRQPEKFFGETEQEFAQTVGTIRGWEQFGGFRFPDVSLGGPIGIPTASAESATRVFPPLVDPRVEPQGVFDAHALQLIVALIDTRVEQLLHARRFDNQAAAPISQRSSAAEASPVEMLSPAEFAQRLGLTSETVRLRERDGELYSVVPSGKKNGRKIPSFQLWNGVQGNLTNIIKTLRARGGSAVHAFMTSQNNLLCMLSPIEVLSGRVMGASVSHEGLELLGLTHDERKRIVEEAVVAFEADLS